MKRLLALISTILALSTPVFSAQQALETTSNPAYVGNATTLQGDDIRLTAEANSVKQQAMNTELYSLVNAAVSAWVTNKTYTSGTQAVVYGGYIYICKANHLSSSTTEPGIGANWTTAWNLWGAAYVTLTGDQTIAGIKTFSVSPIVPTPTADMQASTKKYVDDAVLASGGYSNEQAQDAVGTMVVGNTQTGITVTYDDPGGKLNFVVGNAQTATALQTSRNIGGVPFNGTTAINLPGVNIPGNQDTTGTASNSVLFGGRAVGTFQNDLDVPTQAEAEAGTATTERVWTAQRVKQAVVANSSSGGLTSQPTTAPQSIHSTAAGAYQWNNDVVVNADVGTLMTATSFSDFRSKLGLGDLAIVSSGSGIPAMLAIAPGSAGGPTTTIRNGTSALRTSAIPSGSCAEVVTTAATGVATTDVINWGFNSDPTGVTGYTASGMLTIVAYPSANNVNFKVCNQTASSITPGAVTLNWRVQR